MPAEEAHGFPVRVLQLGPAAGAVGGCDEHPAGHEDAGSLSGGGPRIGDVVQHVAGEDRGHRAAPERQPRRVEASDPHRAGGPAALDDRSELAERQVAPNDADSVEYSRTHR